MNLLALIAPLLIVAVGLTHSVLGERLILGPLFRNDRLPELLGSTVFVKRTLRFAWHVTSLILFGLAGILPLLPKEHSHSEDIQLVFVGTFIASAAWALLETRGKHFAWAVFLAIAAFGWYWH